ncbi:MAG: hypothetical protein H7123_09815 [Thermoleophilia bacterium]|nr:hypothetical protein [Thermoleophilia bacterium]
MKESHDGLLKLIASPVARSPFGGTAVTIRQPTVFPERRFTEHAVTLRAFAWCAGTATADCVLAS